MWRMTPRLATATLTATLALAFAFGNVPKAQAAAVQTYSDQISGNIAGTYSGPITFSTQSNLASFTTPGTVTLGEFITNPLPATATLTYNDTPFTINLNVGATNPYTYGYGYGYYPNTYQYQISGVLNGSISGDGTSSMTAVITSITGSGSGSATSPPFPIADLVISPQGIAAPSTYSDGYTTLTGQILVAGSAVPPPSSLGPGSPVPTPEPSTLVVFGFALAGWACHRGSKAKRARG